MDFGNYKKPVNTLLCTHMVLFGKYALGIFFCSEMPYLCGFQSFFSAQLMQQLMQNTAGKGASPLFAADIFTSYRLMML